MRKASLKSFFAIWQNSSRSLTVPFAVFNSSFSTCISKPSLYSPILVVKQIQPSRSCPGSMPTASIPYGRQTVVPVNLSRPGTSRLEEDVTYPRILQLLSVPRYTSPRLVSPAFRVREIFSFEKRRWGCSYSNFPFNSCSVFFFNILHLTVFCYSLYCFPL